MGHELGHCATCEQWHQINPSQGYCQNRSPVVDPQAFLGLMGDKSCHGPKTIWPMTGPHDWCGDHMNKIDETIP